MTALQLAWITWACIVISYVMNGIVFYMRWQDRRERKAERERSGGDGG